MISLRKICKNYDWKVLSNITYAFKENNIYVLKGPSGSGKTTLLNIISGIDEDYQGTYSVNGKSLKKMSSAEKEKFSMKIGYILQQSLLFHNLSVLDNLLFVKNDIKKIHQLSEEFGTKDLLDKMPVQLSGGERQRVALVRALLHDCDIILADEPTSSLDMKNSLAFLEQLKKVKNKIIIIATHKDIYDDIANAVLYLKDGNIRVLKEKVQQSNKISVIQQKENTLHKIDLKEIFKFVASKKKAKKLFRFSLGILITIVTFSIMIWQNYDKFYFQKIKNEKPYGILELSNDLEKELVNYVDYTYDEYRFYYKDMVGYPLLKKEDSSLNRAEILYGSFPNNENEVLINIEFAQKYFPDSPIESIINQELKIDEKMAFQVSGVINLKDESPFEIYYSNFFYSDIYVNTENGDIINPAFFIPYSTIEKIGKKVCHKKCSVLAKITDDNLYDLYFHPERILKQVYKLEFTNYTNWKNILSNEIGGVQFISQIIVLGIIIVGLFSFLFISNQIQLDLFYRRKELGYLQLFHFSKNKIKLMILFDYLYDVFYSFCYSFAFSSVIITCLIINNVSFSLMIPIFLIVSSITTLYAALVILIPIKRMLKKSIKELIQ